MTKRFVILCQFAEHMYMIMSSQEKSNKHLPLDFWHNDNIHFAIHFNFTCPSVGDTNISTLLNTPIYDHNRDKKDKECFKCRNSHDWHTYKFLSFKDSRMHDILYVKWSLLAYLTFLLKHVFTI